MVQIKGLSHDQSCILCDLQQLLFGGLCPCVGLAGRSEVSWLVSAVLVLAEVCCRMLIEVPSCELFNQWYPVTWLVQPMRSQGDIATPESASIDQETRTNGSDCNSNNLRPIAAGICYATARFWPTLRSAEDAESPQAAFHCILLLADFPIESFILLYSNVCFAILCSHGPTLFAEATVCLVCRGMFPNLLTYNLTATSCFR